MPSRSVKAYAHNYSEFLESKTSLDHRSHRSKKGRKPPTKDWNSIMLYKDRLNRLKEEELEEELDF